MGIIQIIKNMLDKFFKYSNKLLLTLVHVHFLFVVKQLSTSASKFINTIDYVDICNLEWQIDNVANTGRQNQIKWSISFPACLHIQV